MPIQALLTGEVSLAIHLAIVFASRRVIPFDAEPISLALDGANIPDGAYIFAIRHALAQDGLGRVHGVVSARCYSVHFRRGT